ncbi:MAG TPA: DUF1553 domain-containing protein [Verrucomicrobiae bacterium]|nr:DUF1553 domain-containing protein [Verrucomicrobiae bacterium]
MKARFTKALAVCGWLSLATPLLAKDAPAELSRADQEFFERRIRPIFTDHCFKCHSAQAEKVKGGLLLDSREGWMKGAESGPVIVPGEPDQSKLILAVRRIDSDTAMPPKEPLKPEQVADLEAWVKMGAPDPRKKAAPGAAYSAVADVPKARLAWPYTPVSNPAPPATKRKDWARDPVDQFILARLEENRLTPAAPAEKRVLIRRATFDLTGLPPKPEDVQAFLADNSKDAFAKVIDRLLATPQFGERWGRHWLDVARYADSNGLEFNVNYDNAWRYRDYVIAAFNNDKPLNEFIREQLAGDLIPAKDEAGNRERIVATGFLSLGPKVLGEDRDKQVMDVVDEQIDVTTRGFLGLTVSCARCHDHKFDPIPTRDYYALAGVFKSTATLADGNPRQPGQQPVQWVERPLGSPEQMKVVEEYDAKLARLSQELTQAQRSKVLFGGGINSALLPGIVMDNKAAQLTGPWKTSAGTTNHFVDRDYLHDGNADKGKKSVRYAPNLPKAGQYEVRMSYAASMNRATNVPVTVYALGDARMIHVNQMLLPPIEGAFLSLGTYSFEAGTNGAVVISNEGTKGFVIADAIQFLPVGGEAMMAMDKTASKKVTDPTMQMAPSKADPDDLQQQVFDLQDKAPPRPEMAMAVKEGQVGNTKINLRGDVKRLGDEVPRGFIQVAFQPGVKQPEIPPSESGRLELANWIASADNPLTARVAVNRVWLHLFGRGLVATPDNFGNQAERPAQPELLDYLAGRFVTLGWSHKKLIRELMLSSAYQMSSAFNAAAHEKDPDNRLVWRMPRRRLEAEALRDAILSVSGNLDLKVGGPALASDRDIARQGAPQMAAMPTSTGNRRSVYVPILRNNVLDMFQLFDFADPHVISGRRNTTSAPTQALFMMNSPFMQDESKAAAARLKSEPDNKNRVAVMFERSFGRPPTAAETEQSLKYVADYAAQLEKTEPDSAERETKAWQSFCHALFASAEFRFID